MGLATDRLEFVGAAAAEIDRLVVRGHDRAGEYPDKPAAMVELTAFPHLLSFAAIVLLKRPLVRADIARIVPFTPMSLIDGLIDNNVAEGVVSEQDGQLVLTDGGRRAAEGVVAVQEAAMAEVWSAVPDHVKVVEQLATQAVQHGRAIGAPRTPSNFEVFAAVCDRPTLEGTTLRLITSVRYWRADTHARALAEADLRPFEAHALNRLWDAQRGVDRIGQGFGEPGSKGVASLEVRGLAESGAITGDGVDVRERIERETDVLTAPIYGSLDVAAQDELLAALRALPA
jgi:hypothetical protein